MKLNKEICKDCISQHNKGTIKTWDVGYVVCPKVTAKGLFSDRYITARSDGPKENCPWILEHTLACEGALN